VIKSNDFSDVFRELRKIMHKSGKKLSVVHDADDYYFVNGFYSDRFKKNIMFGYVQIKKNYVSYHLMPVYMYKEIISEITPGLKKRMQGKSCFNFNKVDAELFNQLSELTEKSYKLFISKKDNITIKC